SGLRNRDRAGSPVAAPFTFSLGRSETEPAPVQGFYIDKPPWQRPIRVPEEDQAPVCPRALTKETRRRVTVRALQRFKRITPLNLGNVLRAASRHDECEEAVRIGEQASRVVVPAHAFRDVQ